KWNDHDKEDKKNIVMEFLHAKTYIIEMSDEIIDIANKNKDSAIIREYLEILYEFLTDETLDDQKFYDSWNAEALLNFKWNSFEKYYYCLMWGFFTVYLLSFGVASSMPSSAITDTLLRISIVLGSFYIFHEFRQFVWDERAYITDQWNWFDLAAYIFPVYASIFWLNHEKPQLCFAHASYLILAPNEIYDMNHPVMNDDPNNPWNLVDKYQSVSPDGSTIVYSKLPDSKVNQFITYKTSLLAMYLFLTGDPSAFNAWTYLENPFMTILLVMFSCLIVDYLMNLFIGLLNLEIENIKHFPYLLRKAKVLVEIKLFLLLPNQRRWSHWFPDLLHTITEIDNSLSHYQPHISDKLRKFAEMKNVISKSEGSDDLLKKFEKLEDKLNLLLEQFDG
ncbi:12593_t:CDS:2, partial [Funneliformis geosporum]